jgi:fructose-1,6-bisphosphatase/inositol monophosphatase family enzyme
MQNFGALNGHAAGIIMKELVRRAIAAIRAERFRFDVSGKSGYDGSDGDLVTSADRKAQEVYLRGLNECFAGIGIVAEEDDVLVPCTLPGTDAYFTLDPLDGTRAFARRQSHGVGTMLALVVDGQVESAFVGDVMSREVYGYRPASGRVHRISDLDVSEPLVIDTSRPLSAGWLLLHDSPRHYSTWTRHMLRDRRMCADYEVMGGSVGTWAARLWKGEVAAAMLPAGYDTPWDSAPVLGISRALGLATYRIAETGPVPVELAVPRSSPVRREYDLLLVHGAHEAELLAGA